MNRSEDLRNRLLQACDEEYRKARSTDRGSTYPDPSKLIGEGIAAGRGAIETTPLDPDPVRYLASLQSRLEALRAARRANSTTTDGHDDEDGYVLGGLATVARLMEREAAGPTGWWSRIKQRILGR